MDQKKLNTLKEILTRSNAGDDIEGLKKEAKEFLQGIDANDLMMAEQELVDKGIDPKNLQHLCAAHLEIVNSQLDNKTLILPENHPLKTLIAEHDIILNFLSKLEKLNIEIQKATDSMQLGNSIFEELEEVAYHLVEAEKHHLREEKVLFPEVEKRGMTGPAHIMRLEHQDLRAAKKALYVLSRGDHENFEKFKERLDQLSKHIVLTLRDHIFKENNILYPSSLNLIKDQAVWNDMKQRCDNIGYCCFTPSDVSHKNEDKDIVTLDLRKMPPFERHSRIFELWNQLNKGQSLLIINDHDPKPLYYQFNAELGENFEWSAIEEGPKDWRVQILKK